MQLMMKTMNVNCFGIYRMTKALFPLIKQENEKLKAAGEGTCSIVNMTSMAGKNITALSDLLRPQTLNRGIATFRTHCCPAGERLLHLQARSRGPEHSSPTRAKHLWHSRLGNRGTIITPSSPSRFTTDPVALFALAAPPCSPPSPTRQSWWQRDSDWSPQRYISPQTSFVVNGTLPGTHRLCFSLVGALRVVKACWKELGEAHMTILEETALQDPIRIATEYAALRHSPFAIRHTSWADVPRHRQSRERTPERSCSHAHNRRIHLGDHHRTLSLSPLSHDARTH
jgi:hypothetical protein